MESLSLGHSHAPHLQRCFDGDPDGAPLLFSGFNARGGGQVLKGSLPCMIFLSQASEESSKTFVMSFLQPFSEFMVGGAEKLFLGELLFLLNNVKKVIRSLIASKDPLQKLFLKVLLVEPFGGVMRNSCGHFFQVLKKPRVAAMVGKVDLDAHFLP